MKTADLRAKSQDELQQSLMDLRKEQFNFRFQKTTGKIEDTSRIRTVRRDIAKIKTLLNETKSGKEPVAKPAKAAKKAPAKKKAKE
ncbi:MAG: 50S ribosomal protein L29 [Alphaproteobacteria bacterium]|nr:50S ribosomal protein L29 [Alphaproteobacteria bacterium]